MGGQGAIRLPPLPHRFAPFPVLARVHLTGREQRLAHAPVATPHVSVADAAPAQNLAASAVAYIYPRGGRRPASRTEPVFIENTSPES